MKRWLSTAGIACMVLFIETVAFSSEPECTGKNAEVQQTGKNAVLTGPAKAGELIVISVSQLQDVPKPVPPNPVEKYRNSMPAIRPDSITTYQIQAIRPDPRVGYTLRIVGKPLPGNPTGVSKFSLKPDADVRNIPVLDHRAIEFGK